jgi:hypothetical protein
VQVFGFEAIGTTVAAQLAGIAVALLGVRAWRNSKRPIAGLAAIVAGVAVPGLAWRALATLELLPFRVTESRAIGASVACAILVASASGSARCTWVSPRRSSACHS